MSRVNALYSEAVEITSHYLGPAADRFMSRQVRNHLDKNPEQLVGSDLLKLIDWIRIAMVFLTDDDELIAEYLTSLKRLARKSITRSAHGHR